MNGILDNSNEIKHIFVEEEDLITYFQSIFEWAAKNGNGKEPITIGLDDELIFILSNNSYNNYPYNNPTGRGQFVIKCGVFRKYVFP
jgi:hypothetical protein